MNVQLLIDSIVRETTVLIAQLATTGGVRAPLAQVANRVFLDLTSELEAQGVSKKVSADMFGLALRSYQRKIQRLSESTTDKGRSLWSAVLDHIGEKKVVTRSSLLERFHRDEETLVRGVVKDLVDSGLVFSSGTGNQTKYRVAEDGDLEVGGLREQRPDEIVWVMIYRQGPLSREVINERNLLSENALDECLDRLLASGRIEETDEGFVSKEVILPLDSSIGWEAAVLDHYHSVVSTLVARLRTLGEPTSSTGGSTYTFDVWPGHPFEEEALGLLGEFRARATELRERVEGHNAGAEVPESFEPVIAYMGQVRRE